MDQPDAYLTIGGESKGEYREKGSKFLAYAFPVNSPEACRKRLEEVRGLHPKARHHCYAWRLGADGNQFRANDDGEPSSTAGKPILGQIDRWNLTDLIVIVVRYFGGVLLGASGLINAYRSSAADALSHSQIIEKTFRNVYRLRFPYERMGDVMSAVERLKFPLIDQAFSETAEIHIAIRQSDAEAKLAELRALVAGISLNEAAATDAVEGLQVDFLRTEAK